MGAVLSGCLWQLPREVFQGRVEDGVMPYGRVLCEGLVYRSGHLDAEEVLPAQYPSPKATAVRPEKLPPRGKDRSLPQFLALQ